MITSNTYTCNIKYNLSQLCSSRAWWPLASNFCPQATRKSQIFHTNHVLGTLDFTVSEHWAPFNFPQSTALLINQERGQCIKAKV